MTLGHFLNHMGIGPKQLTDRFTQTDYGMAHDPHSYYAHEPAHSSHHVADSKQFTQTDYGMAHDPHSYYAHEPAHSSHHVADSKQEPQQARNDGKPHHHHGGGGGGHKNNAAMSALTLLAFLFFLHILQQCLKEHMAAMSTPQVVVMTGGREGEQTIAKTTLLDFKDENVEAKSPGNQNKIEESKFKSAKEDSFTKIPTAEHTPFEKHKNKFGNQNSFPGFFSAMDD